MFTVYHNPRCSKSRNTLALMDDHDIDYNVVLYLETPLDAEAIKLLLQQLSLSARDLLRRGEDAYKQLNLADKNLTEEQLIEAMVAHPKLIERPIVSDGQRAVLGRPPENVLELL